MAVRGVERLAMPILAASSSARWPRSVACRGSPRAAERLPNRRGPPPSKVVSCCARPVPARPGSGDRRRRAAGTARPTTEQSVGRAEADRECRHQVAAVEWKELGGEYVGAVRVAEGEAGLGEKHQAGRPHRVPGDGRERVGAELIELCLASSSMPSSAYSAARPGRQTGGGSADRASNSSTGVTSASLPWARRIAHICTP